MNKQKPAPDEDNATKTCFVMMPISDVDGYPVGHFGEVYQQLIEPAVTAAGYECTLATSTSAAHMIQLDVVTKVATADLCICDLSTNNPNVMFEYGIRQAFDKPTVLIKDDKTRRIFDLSGFRDIEYDHTLRIANTLSARAQITKAIEDTVNGSGDEEQVFSLVKLMKLTKAAHLPSGELSKDDARFALLERKLDRLFSLQNSARGNLSGLEAIAASSSMNHTYSNDRYIILSEKGAIRILDPLTGEVAVYSSMTGLKQSEFFKSLTDAQKHEVWAAAKKAILP
ncbi:hypothetical protein ASE36_01895 [Rhizobium sp. Root274]|uniref:hypothetical protein n=1 Tax=unclassified Rhizobium TaxID=2613769 RepID=UPI00071547C8|nr:MULTISPECIES: hypothetical protein [unclassified Rhizobium]KRD32613.1 hypothetical protein ASE36_01895 [Rhizobium sp. Root274]